MDFSIPPLVRAVGKDYEQEKEGERDEDQSSGRSNEILNFFTIFYFLGPLRIKNFDKTFMSIEWSKPLFDGGESVTGYSIEIRDASRIDWVSSPTIEKLN